MAKTNAIAATVRTEFPSWYTKHYGNQKAEHYYKRILGSVIYSEIIQPFQMLSLKQIESMIDDGLKRLIRQCETPPNIKKIVELFLTIDDLPDFETAWQQALTDQGVNSHAIIKEAAIATGIFDLKHSGIDNPTLKDRFRTQFLIKLRLFREKKLLTDHCEVIEDFSNEPIKTAADLAFEQHEAKVLERIKQQGISLNPQEARNQCLSSLGLKPRTAAASAENE